MSSQAHTPSSSLARVFRFVCVLAAGTFALYCLSGTSHLDRFVWPVTLVTGLLLVAFYFFEDRKLPTSQPSLWSQHANLGGAVLWVCLAVTAIALSVNTATYDAALWRGGQLAVSKGVTAATVDAGFEWVGAHASSPADPARGKGYAVGYPNMFHGAERAVPTPCFSSRLLRVTTSHSSSLIRYVTTPGMPNDHPCTSATNRARWSGSCGDIRLTHPSKECHITDGADPSIEVCLHRWKPEPYPHGAVFTSSTPSLHNVARRSVSLSTTGRHSRWPRRVASVDFPEPGAPLIKMATGSCCIDKCCHSRVGRAVGS